MAGTSRPRIIYPQLQRVATLASEAPTMVMTTLAHHIDSDLLREAYRLIRKDGAAGIDGVTAADYEVNLEDNLDDLLRRFKTGQYRAPAVRRVYIPKAGGKRRPIGIPTLEDKVLQKAVSMVMESVYEQDFMECSYGFRPGRSAHQALDALWKGLMGMGGGVVIEVDIEDFFGTLDRHHLETFLDQRIRDGVIRRTIGKWFNAGVMEDGHHSKPEKGTPQGGNISPILANVYLHHVLDVWFAQEVLPRLRGKAFLVRYADDCVIVCEREDDASKIMAVLPKRCGKYGLQLHHDKTRMLTFRPPSLGSGSGVRPGTFDFLGFTHHWGQSRQGRWVVKRRTAKDRLAQSVKAISEWCRLHRHDPVKTQAHELGRKLRGHYGYYGITGNARALSNFHHQVCRKWYGWLRRRSQQRTLTWEQFHRLRLRHPLPPPRVVHSVFRSAASP